MKKNILSKLRKVLALTDSPDPGEAAAAIAMAQELMQRHNISDSDVRLIDVVEKEKGLGRKTPTRYQWHLIQLIRKVFAVEVYVSGSDSVKGFWTVNFVGIGSAAEIASYCYEVLYRKLLKSRAEYYRGLSKRIKRSNRTRYADTYAEYWVNGCHEASLSLLPKTDASNELVALYMSNKELESGKKSRGAKENPKNAHHAIAGYVDGSQVQINKPVSTNKVSLIN